MKKHIVISLLSGIIICCTAIYTFGASGIVKTDDLRLREEGSSSSEIITLLSEGEKVEIIEKTEDGWYKVKYKDYEGYVSSEFVNVEEGTIINTPSVETESEEEQVINEETQKIEVTETQEENILNSEANIIMKIVPKDEKMYGIPLINASTIKIVEQDTIVNVLTEINGWSYIESASLEGWIRTDKLKDEESKITTTTANDQKETGYVTSTTVNFRKEPNTSGEVIKTLTVNKEITILEKVNGWVKAEVDGEIGYISETYVSNTKVATSRGAETRNTKTEVKQETITVTETSITENTTETSNENTQQSQSITGENIVAYAKQYLGYKYVYGGASPSGFDCSGFTQYVYSHFGYTLTRTSSSQSTNGVAVSKGNMQAGDIICFSNSSGSTQIGHVGIYIGGGKFIHSANSRCGVIISNVDGDGFYYVCSRRII